MKENKAVNVTRRCMKHDFRRACVYENHRQRDLVASCEVRYDEGIQEIGCQVDARRDICTCKARTSKHHEARYFTNAPEQIYAYHGVKSYSNIGVGNVKTIHRRRVRKIYLPETDDRGVGSSDASAVIIRKPTHMADSYYVPKKMSSKCIGTFWHPAANAISAKLSPIVKYLCATTGSEMPRKTNVEIGNNTEHEIFATTTTQVESADKRPKESIDPLPKDRNDEKKMSPKTKAYLRNKAREEEKFSSDSLVQHVHDLECPQSVSQEKLSKLSLDPMENKVEKEYRAMFASNTSKKAKHPAPVKSTSLLRRRFEALRRGLKKDDSKKNESDTISSSPPSANSRKNVSIISDPPSLEARSYYDEKPLATASPPKPYEATFRQSVTGKKDSFDTTDDDNEFDQDVSGMFKFWSKKFNLEDSTRIPGRSSDTSKEQDIDKKRSIDSKDAERKTGGKKFSFFKRRSKDKARTEKPYKPKKGVTANRCEVKTGLVLQIGTTTNAFKKAPPPGKREVSADKLEDIQRKAWLKRFLTGNMDSKESVKIRWNNNTYGTSSSAVFELMDNVYKQTGIVIRSKSDIQMNRKSFKPPEKKANFVTQHIEAWMIPRTITDVPVVLPVKMKDTSDKADTACIEVGISEQKRSIDKAKTFDKIMVTVRSSDVEEDNNKSSDYIRIDIPNDFFSESCEEEARGSSDEKVYKIVEYETLKSNTDTRKNTNLDTGDHATNDIRVTVCVKDSEDVKSSVLETVIKRPPTHRDVVIQGSKVGFPKRWDVIGVGILTQRDVRELKPILKIQDDITEDDSGSEHNANKHCEFAESYLQEYCRQWMTGLDPSSWCLSESGIRSPERNSDITLKQGDGTKSCPNIYEEYRPSIISPSHSSCSHSHNLLGTEYKNRLSYKVTSQVTKKNPKIINPKDSSEDVKKTGGPKKGDAAEAKKKQDKYKRVLPKDSLEVSKRRRMYACSNKSRWFSSSPDNGPCSVPSLTDQGAPECPRSCVTQTKPKGPSNKHVSVVECKSPCAEPTKSLEGILNFKGSSGCAVCKKTAGLSKVMKVGSSCEIPPKADPLCKEKCKKKRKPPCKKNAEPCPHSPLSSSSVISKISGYSDKCPVVGSAKPCPPPPCPPPSKCPTVCPSPPKCPDPSPPKCPDPSPPKCPSPPTLPCPPPPPPSVNPRMEMPNSCDCATESNLSSSAYNVEVDRKRCPKKAKPVKCATPPCSGPPSPKCGSCMTPPCSASQQPFPPGIKLSVTSSQESCGSQTRNYPNKCPMTPKPPKKKRNKYSECKKKCSYNQHPKCSTSEVGVGPCTPPETPCPPAKAQPARDACFPPPPCPPSPPSPRSRSPRICSPTSSPPCPSPRQPCPAEAKLPKRGCHQAQPTRSCPEALSNIPPSAPCLPNSTPAIPCSEPEPCPAQNKECPISCKDWKPKFNGFLLRKLPRRKTCAEDCSSWANVDNCDEHLNIRIKERTPSTEAIRQMKLKGDDGVTLCERREYTKQEKRSIHRPAVLGEMYQPNICHRVSTKSAQIVRSQVDKNISITKVNSRSLDNLVEIQFTMKVTQGDKVTEINIGNDRDVEEKTVQVPNFCSKEVYVANNHACTTTDVPERVASNDTKNDINIHIVIKNFKHKDKKKPTDDMCQLNEDFANKISQKFHTVSTAYSDLHPDVDRNEATHAISIHRATWDLTGSDEKFKTQPSGDVSDFTDKEIKKTETSQSMTTEEKSSWSEKGVETKSEAEKDDDEEEEDEVDDHKDTDKEIYKVDVIDINPTTDETDLDIGIEVTHSNHESSDGTDLSPREAKKKLLKILIEKAGKIKHKNKTKVSKLTKMLKPIMTTSESSGNADTTVPENGSVKHIVDSYLKTSMFRDTGSMNNLYQVSNMTSDNEDFDPDKESDNSDVSFKGNSCLGCACLCKTVAAKLNVSEQGGCCCKSPIKTYVSIETNCDIRTDEETSSVLNYEPLEYIDEGTQRSKLFFSKANSANVSSSSVSMKDIIELSNVKNVRESKINPGHDIATALSLNISAHPAQIEIDKEYDYRKFNRETVLNMSDDDKIIVANMEPKREGKDVIAHVKPVRIEMETEVSTEESDIKEKSIKVIAPADVLQSYETKKAVLEIYTKKTICNGRKQLVAKLPKFTIESESQIIKYEKICTRSVVMSFKS